MGFSTEEYRESLICIVVDHILHLEMVIWWGFQSTV